VLQGKKIVLSVSGGIAAYKSVYLLRLLASQGAEVRVILTENAQAFVGTLTFSALSNHPVYTDVISNKDTGEWTNHVALGKWADAFLVAPATSVTISKILSGMADNLLVLSLMSADCPVFVAPAMDLDMYTHSSNKANLNSLQERGYHVIDAEEGFLASGLIGKGRLASEPRIVGAIEDHFFAPQKSLRGKKVLVNAGPTHEAIDPVRYIANRSTGKMGYALARAAHAMGADVTLVSGPTALEKPFGVKVVDVTSAQEMFGICEDEFAQADIAILSAAVADYAPRTVFDQKIKKKTDELSLELSRTKDILASLGEQKQENQCLVGFALETQNALEYGRDKMQRKNCNFIVVNTLEDAGAGFAHDSNKVYLLDKHGGEIEFPLQSKITLAFKLLENIGKAL
jgi:phosphopantothenoylcysteine decarboxylase/phosphopantothenate--cysteine ligase